MIVCDRCGDNHEVRNIPRVLVGVGEAGATMELVPIYAHLCPKCLDGLADLIEAWRSKDWKYPRPK